MRHYLISKTTCLFLITGMFASSLGSQHLRGKVPLSENVKCFTEYLRDAGYYCANFNKTDYNFDVPSDAWDLNGRISYDSLVIGYLENLPGDKPFFCVINLSLTHQSKTRYDIDKLNEVNNKLPVEARHNPDKVPIPPYYPNTPDVRTNLAALHTQISLMDMRVKEILKQLEESGISDNNIRISSDFPGGNIVVNKISKDTLWLKPDLSFTEGEWFYWYFKVSNISGKKITFHFDQNNVFAKYGPAYSLNNNNTWKWYGEKRIVNNSFTYSFTEQDTTAYFSMAIPYTEKNLNDFILNLNNKELLKIDTLCLSPEKRIIEQIAISPSNMKPSFKVLITARHHACEMIANYVLEGLIESVLNEKDLEVLRNNVDFLIIPFMDKDGVENGEQGKNRIPRDHNRDYDNNSIHNSTAALRTMIPIWGEEKVKIALDIHCPWIKGEGHEYIYIVGNSDSVIEKN